MAVVVVVVVVRAAEIRTWFKTNRPMFQKRPQTFISAVKGAFLREQEDKAAEVFLADACRPLRGQI